MSFLQRQFPRPSRFYCVMVAASAAITIGAAIMEWRAPQLLVLASGGFPSATWPTPGVYALVEGAEMSGDRSRGAALPGPAQIRFDESDGRALLVDRGGALVTEFYGNGIDRDAALNSFSLVKSLVGALVQRAVADHRLDGLDTPLRDVLGPDAPDATVGEALTMTSGLVMEPEPPKSGDATLDDAGFSPFGPLARIHAYGVEAMLADLHVDGALRGQFHYQSANTALLGLVLERAYGRPLPELLSESIWRPAGAVSAHWRQYPAGDGVSAYCCLYARPLDWLRVGRFLLNNGTPDAPFLPEELWNAFLAPTLDADIRRQGVYGLHVRHDVLDRPGEALQGPFAYFMGHEGQMVYLLPEQDAVVVRFGERPQLLHSTLYELFPG